MPYNNPRQRSNGHGQNYSFCSPSLQSHANSSPQGSYQGRPRPVSVYPAPFNVQPTSLTAKSDDVSDNFFHGCQQFQNASSLLHCFFLCAFSGYDGSWTTGDSNLHPNVRVLFEKTRGPRKAYSRGNCNCYIKSSIVHVLTTHFLVLRSVCRRTSFSHWTFMETNTVILSCVQTTLERKS